MQDPLPFAHATVLLSVTPDNHLGHQDTMAPFIPSSALTVETPPQKTSQPRVILADDHRLRRLGLASVLCHEGGCLIAAEWENLSALESAAPDHAEAPPDVVIVATRLPDIREPGRLDRLRSLYPASRWLLMSQDKTPGSVYWLRTCAVEGLLMEDEDPQLVVEAVYSVLAGKRFCSQQLRHELARDWSETTTVPSARELEALEFICAGLTNKGIAREMGISIKTVEKHREALMRKLDAHNAASLLLQARVLGWL